MRSNGPLVPHVSMCMWLWSIEIVAPLRLLHHYDCCTITTVAPFMTVAPLRLLHHYDCCTIQTVGASGLLHVLLLLSAYRLAPEQPRRSMRNSQAQNICDDEASFESLQHILHVSAFRQAAEEHILELSNIVNRLLRCDDEEAAPDLAGTHCVHTYNHVCVSNVTVFAVLILTFSANIILEIPTNSIPDILTNIICETQTDTTLSCAL